MYDLNLWRVPTYRSNVSKMYRNHPKTHTHVRSDVDIFLVRFEIVSSKTFYRENGPSSETYSKLITMSYEGNTPFLNVSHNVLFLTSEYRQVFETYRKRFPCEPSNCMSVHVVYHSSVRHCAICFPVCVSFHWNTLYQLYVFL